MTSNMSSNVTSNMTSNRPRTPLGKRAVSARRKPLLFTAILNPLGSTEERPQSPKPKFTLKRRRARGLPSLTPIGSTPAKPAPLSPTPQVRVRRPMPQTSPQTACPTTATLADLAPRTDHMPHTRLGRPALRIGGQVFVLSLGAMAVLFSSEWLISRPAAAFPPQAAIWNDGIDNDVRLAEPRPAFAPSVQLRPEIQQATSPPHEPPPTITVTASAGPIAPVPRPRPQTVVAQRPVSGPPTPRRHPTRVVRAAANPSTTFELGSVAPVGTDNINSEQQASLTPVDPVTTIPPYRFMRLMS